MADAAYLTPLPGKFSSVRAVEHTVVDGAGLWLFRLSHDLVALQCHKRMAAAHGTRLIEFLDKALVTSTSLSVMVDLEAAPAYDSEARNAVTAWSLKTRGKLKGYHVLTSSRMVSMALATASLILEPAGIPIVSYAQRPEFEAAMLRLAG